jgi:hypothetical protein
MIENVPWEAPVAASMKITLWNCAVPDRPATVPVNVSPPSQRPRRESTRTWQNAVGNQVPLAANGSAAEAASVVIQQAASANASAISRRAQHVRVSMSV